jgi:glycolate oxidase iron-sulfur subunit
MGAVRLLLRRVVHRPRLLHAAARLGSRIPLLGGVLPAAADLADGFPEVPQRPARRRLPARLSAAPPGRGEATLFLGCIQDAVFGDDNVAVARTAAACGFDVAVPRGQTCCGALHLHVGDRPGFLRRAALNCRVLAPGDGGGGPIVVGAAGCSAVLREYGRLLAGTPWAAQGEALGRRVRDFAEFVAEVSPPAVAMPPAGAPVRVTWHDPCHLCHAQGVRRQPRELLRNLPGIEYVEMEEADACCGSAGVYNLLQPELAARVLERKVAHVAATGARWVVTENPGCALQLRAGLRRAGHDIRVVALAQVLADAYGAEER